MSPDPPTESSALTWLFAQQRFGIHPGLARVRALLASLGDPQQHFATVLVGGTNGKGSTAATLASIGLAAGQRTALFTSPHLTYFNERFQVNGACLPEAQILDALEAIKPEAEALGASFFEIVTALGCLLFAEHQVELAVMEVGLGGRLDATNVLEPELSLVTNVALDHTEFLGETPQQIAAEKAGILREGRLAVTAVEPALWPILDEARADLWALGRNFTVEVQALGWQGSRLKLWSPRGELSGQTPLLGQHGAQNAALAAIAAQRLGVQTAAIQRGMIRTHWPGRLELIKRGQQAFLLDGAHNPHGAKALAQAVRALGVGPIPLIFGLATDKDSEGIVAALRPLASEVILTRAVLSPRAAGPERLAPLFDGLSVKRASSPAEALALVSLAPMVLICGSLYLLGEVRPLLYGEIQQTFERWQ